MYIVVIGRLVVISAAEASTQSGCIRSRLVARIEKTAVNYLPSGDTSGSSSVVSDVAWDFYGIIQDAEDLTQISLMASDAVRTIGIYPYDAEAECFEVDVFRCFCPSEDNKDNCGASRFDDEDFLFDEND